MATREEHLAYVEDLFAKEDNNTINEAEKNARETYRKRFVRDDQGCLDVDGGDVRDNRINWDAYGLPSYGAFYGLPSYGALFVRTSAESK